MNARRPLLTTFAALLLAAGAARAGEPAAGPDTRAWPCRFCVFDSGASGWLEPRAGYVSDASFHFGDYTGLEDQGLFGDLGGAWRWRGAESGDAWDLRAERLGLDSRAVGLRGGRQGSYRVELGYDALPHLLSRDSHTIFVGDGPLALPSGWTRSGSTRGMTALDASLHPAWLRQERERLALGVEFVPQRATELRFDYRRDEIRGTAATGGSFMTLASLLPRQIDQTLDRADVAASFRHALGHAQLALSSSFFANGIDALAWQNPYSGPTSGANNGQMSEAPDNRAHRVSLSLGSPPGARLHAASHLALGRMTQDERFLPATVNPDEQTALPRASLDGRVDTTFASTRIAYRITPTTRMLVDVLYDRRDNRTPVAAYTQVVMDTFTGDVRRNTPFGSQRDRWRLSVEDRTVRGLRLGAGLDQEARERRFYGTATTDETRYWGRVGWRPLPGGDLRVRFSHAEREGAEVPADPAAPAQNPLLRSYQTATRDRDEVRTDLGLSQGALTTTFNLIYGREDYPDSTLGRSARREFGYGADAAVRLGETLALSGFASRRLQDTEQTGSASFGTPDWVADQEDATAVIGAHVDWQAPRGFDVGADYVYSSSEGTIAMASGAGETGFPLLVTRWHDARVFGRYALRPDLALRLDLVRERYQAYDWALDGVTPAAVPNLLALGQGTRSGAVTAVVLGLRYEFRSAPPAD